MAYNKEQLEEEILQVIEAEELTFFTEISLFVKPALSTLYELELEKSEDIKALLSKNKVRQKSAMRKKWRASDNPALQIAAFKLIAEPDEIERLTTSKVDANVKGDMSMTWNEVKNYGTNREANHSP